MAYNLSISLVIYQPNIDLLQQTLSSLYQSICQAQNESLLASFSLTIVDNTEENKRKNINDEVLLHWLKPIKWCFPEKNLGYGEGHNLAIQHHCEELHLVINPDVSVGIGAISQAIQYLSKNDHVGLITPYSEQANGKKDYLCKAYPTIFVLLLRGFAPQQIKACFKQELHVYEERNRLEEVSDDVILASGCFMFFRGEALRSVNGFDTRFFLYFEDFDLSLRLRKTWAIAYVPTVKIIHFGGGTAKKGLKHIILFLKSAYLFFNRFGWRVLKNSV